MDRITVEIADSEVRSADVVDPDGDYVYYIDALAEINRLRALLVRVDDEFGILSDLDCPEYVTPNNTLWDDVRANMITGE